jgi:hypothetical protein
MIRFVKPERLLVLCSRNAGSRAVTDWPRDARARQKRPSNRAAFSLGRGSVTCAQIARSGARARTQNHHNHGQTGIAPNGIELHPGARHSVPVNRSTVAAVKAAQRRLFRD